MRGGDSIGVGIGFDAGRPPLPELRTDVRPWAQASTVGDLLVAAIARDPTGDAVVFPDERLSAEELGARARQIASGLIGLGVQRGDRVGLLMANSPDCVACMFAIALAGAVIVPINTRYRALELPFVVRDSGVEVVISSDRIDDYADLVGLLSDALPGLSDAQDRFSLELPHAPALRSVIALGARERLGTLSERDLLAAAKGVSPAELEHRRNGVRLRDDALILYTSGTTAMPRGCRLSHEAIVRNWSVVAQILQVGPRDRVWAPCPLFHLGAVGPLLACVCAGAAFLSDTWFSPQRALRLIERERATHLYPAYPPITQGLLDQPELASADLSAARVMLNVGPEDVLRQMQAALPHVVQVSLYGSTEGGGAITYNSLDEDLEARVCTTGLPLPGTELRIIDPDSGQDLGVGGAGEIVLRSVGLFEGYVDEPAGARSSVDEQGWYRTGDRGALDERGRLRFLGRLKEMMKVGGENVAPAEIESALSTHPSVKLVQVVGVPDERLEEVPAAFIECRAGAVMTEQEAIEHCRGRIARFKVPRYVRFVQEWPLSATKIQRGVLRAQLIAELEQRRQQGEIADLSPDERPDDSRELGVREGELR